MAGVTSIKLNIDGYAIDDVILKVSSSSTPTLPAVSLTSDSTNNDDTFGGDGVVCWTKGELLQLVGETDGPPAQWQRHPSFQDMMICVVPRYNCSNVSKRMGYIELLALSMPTALLAGLLGSWFFARGAAGYDAVFPSYATTGIAFKISIWGTLASIVFHEQFHYWNKTKTGLTHLTVHLSSSADLHSTTSTSPTVRAIHDKPSRAIVASPSPSADSHSKPNADTTTTSTNNNANAAASSYSSNSAIPFRFIRAEKGDIKSAKSRWLTTLQWRQDMGMDTILQQPHSNFQIIKQNYPHYFHLRGKNNEPCYYETPPKINLKAMRDADISMDDLLRHYALCCEFMWTVIEPTEDGKSIYVINLEGMGMRDFAGEVVDFVKRASSFTAAHYPERSGTIFIINVPSWFSIIWNAVKGLVDDVTKQKIKIIKQSSNPDRIKNALLEKIDIQNIPPEYGGQSVPLGQSPEELLFQRHFERLNKTTSTIDTQDTNTNTNNND